MAGENNNGYDGSHALTIHDYKNSINDQSLILIITN